MCLPALPILGAVVAGGGAAAAGATTATVLGATSLGLAAGSQIEAGRQAKDAYSASAAIAQADAAHRKQVADYNAGILREQAIRLRNEQTSRISEVGNINLGRLGEDLDMNVGRIKQVTGINLARVNESTDTNIKRISESAMISSARIQQVADENVRRLEKQATQTIERGGEDENAVRRIGAETISSQRAFYGARNVVIDTGTPAAMQVDTARMAEVDALRIRRNYRLQAESILQQADDIKRDASWQVGDINRVAAYQISDLQQQRSQTISDLTREMSWQVGDMQRTTGQQIQDITRNMGYDLSDVEFEAKKLDQQAALTILQGDAEMAAGLNRTNAYKQAGSDAMTQSILSAAGTVIGGVNPKWFNSSSAAAT